MTTTYPAKDSNQIQGIKFNIEKLKKEKIIENDKKIKLYVNAFPIKFNKDIRVYEYPFTIEPENKEEYIISKIFRDLYKEIHKIYGFFYRSGNSFYSVKEELNPNDFKITIENKGQIEYNLKVDKKAETTTIKKGQTTNFSQIHEKIIFLIMREILTTNPNVKVDKDNFYLENNPKEVEGTGQTYFIHDGYKLSLKQTEVGLCLIVGIKNRIKGDLNVYDALMNEECNYGDNLDERIENLIGKRFVHDQSSKSKIIYDIDTELTPKNTSINYGKESFSNYIKFFKNVFKKDIVHEDQPMILVRAKGPEGEEKFIKYVPEFCRLNGINENDINISDFMRELSQYTKLEPDEKVRQIDKCIDLFLDKTEKRPKDEQKEDKKDEGEKKEDEKDEGEKKENEQKGKKKKKKKKRKNKNGEKDNKIEEEDKKEKPKEEDKKEEEKNENTINEIDIYNTSDKKREFYGIEISKLKNISSFYILKPTFNNGKYKNLQLNSIYTVCKSNIDTSQWLCLYHKSLDDSTYNLLDMLKYCQKSLGIKVENENSNWIKMNSDEFNDWKETIEEEIAKNKARFVIFFISNKNNHLYSKLKKHSNCDNGYISQVIKYESFNNIKKKASYISKILLQINSKLGGVNYKLNLDSNILDKNIMFIGIDFGLNSSHTWEKRKKGAMAMVATRDKYYSKFFSRNVIIDCQKKDYNLSIQESISNFIDIAIKKYEKEEKGNTPRNIIIYRKGISSYQIDYIKPEITIIEEKCKLKSIKYYYVIVNEKTSLKFFELNLKKTEKENGEYKNPQPGLVVFDQVVDKNKFEFYLQPQKVTQGSATPTYFHAIFGNMDSPELLIKLTYWTTYIYPNWQNAIRIPHILKLAEKSSYMTAKVTRKQNKENLSDLLPDL